MSSLFPHQAGYAPHQPGYSPAASVSSPYGQPNDPLAFYAGGGSASSSSFQGGGSYGGSGGQAGGFDGNGVSGNMGSMGSGPSGNMGRMMHDGRWWEAFGTGGFEGEPPLLQGGSSLTDLERSCYDVEGLAMLLSSTHARVSSLLVRTTAASHRMRLPRSRLSPKQPLASHCSARRRPLC